jgi:hypothetical protein
MALVDAHYRFIAVDITVLCTVKTVTEVFFSNSNLGKALE